MSFKEPQIFQPVIFRGPVSSEMKYGGNTTFSTRIDIDYDPNNPEHKQALNTFIRDLHMFGEKEKKMFQESVTERIRYF